MRILIYMELTFFAFYIIALLFSIIIHEISHGYVARWLGDDTAERAGRLTLNPIPHIDLFGSILLPLFLFISHSPVLLGWAKPVPYNPYNLYKDYKYGPLKVALAGPASNILLFVFFIIAGTFFVAINPITASLMGFIAFMNLYLCIFNLIPIPPLDGSKLLSLLFPKAAILLEKNIMFGFLIVFGMVFLFGDVISGFVNLIFTSLASQALLVAMCQTFGLCF